MIFEAISRFEYNALFSGNSSPHLAYCTKHNVAFGDLDELYTKVPEKCRFPAKSLDLHALKC
jgi:hypothetical protein